MDQLSGVGILDHCADVSVVIPCYRSMKTIARAIQSVAAQTLKPREVILVDDCSGDGEASYLETVSREYPAGWIRVVQLAQNLGAACARNAGWELAKEPYVAFLDSDDSWHCRKIEIQYGWMRSHPEIAMTCHKLPMADNRIQGQAHASPEFRSISRRRLLASNVVSTPTVMLKRDIQFRFPQGQRHSEDYALWLSLVVNGIRCARSEAELAFRYKRFYGEGGLSNDLLAMERAELRNYRELHRQGLLSVVELGLYGGLSIAKFIRRLVVSAAARYA